MILIICLITFELAVWLIVNVNEHLLDDWERNAILILLWGSVAGILTTIFYHLAVGVLS